MAPVMPPVLMIHPGLHCQGLEKPELSTTVLLGPIKPPRCARFGDLGKPGGDFTSLHQFIPACSLFLPRVESTCARLLETSTQQSHVLRPGFSRAEMSSHTPRAGQQQSFWGQPHDTLLPEAKGLGWSSGFEHRDPS